MMWSLRLLRKQLVYAAGAATQLRPVAKPNGAYARAAEIMTSPATAAVCALIAIQVGIGILFKAAQSGGKYDFSYSSSITLSEFFKFGLSCILFRRELSQRRRLAGEAAYKPVASDDQAAASNEDDVEASSPTSLEPLSPVTSRPLHAQQSQPLARAVATFIRSFRAEIPEETRYGFAHLALLYALINNSIFVLYKLADPGTINLVKAGITLITAVTSLICLGTQISRIQWIAILLQLSGIIVSQYSPDTGSTYPLTTYSVLLFQTFLSAVSGVYNQNLSKKSNASLHCGNMVLYACGVATNLIIHLVASIIKPEEPSFFAGYGSIGAVMVIVSNVFIGLAITAVYKYADALAKCFATAVSTAILLYISPILFNIHFSFLVMPGTIIVFLATYLYMEANVRKRPNDFKSANATSQQQQQQQKRSAGHSSSLPLNEKGEQHTGIWRLIFSELAPNGRLRHIGIGSAATFSIFLIACLTVWDSKHVVEKSHGSGRGVEPEAMLPKLIESPFKDVVAMIRWNSDSHPERMATIHDYEPFFDSLHFSMPRLVSDEAMDWTNLTHDNWDDSFTMYRGVGNLMREILDDPDQSHIKGIFYYHFDTWIDPLRFQEMNYSKIWFPKPGYPPHVCLTRETVEPYMFWWAHQNKLQDPAMSALALVEQLRPDYVVKKNQWCLGWSDIYYVPRSVFEDWIFLAGVFEGLKVFHEIAVPTILQVIDDTRQTHPTRSLIEDLGDCWGNCCSSHPSKTDIRGHRCGHRLSFEDEDIWPTHFERLAESRQLLGQPWIRQTPIAAGGKKTGKKTDKKAGSEKSGGKKSRGWR